MDENIKNSDNSPEQSNESGFIIGEDFNFDEPDEETPKKGKRRKKKNSVVKNIIWIVSIIVISVAIAFGIIYVGADYMGIGFGRGENCVIEVEQGSATAHIAEKLKECGAVKCPLVFRLYSRIKGYDSQFKYGVYTFNNEAGYDALAEMLMNDGAKAETVTVTIPEGTGINDYTKNVNGEKVTVPGIATLLENAGVCSKADFYTALDSYSLNSKFLSSADGEKTYYTLEGYLFPETYDFYSYDSAECAILAVEKMIKEAESRITDEMYARADELGYSMNEILTMASIVQMEAGKSTDEMANVAGVFYNRLNSESFSTLGSSPTCYYGDSFKYDDGRYNTYNVEGLPPGPLCSPGIDAINAALYPQSSDYYYFVTDSSGNFYYHKTSSEQQTTINRLQQGNQWIYEYFE